MIIAAYLVFAFLFLILLESLRRVLLRLDLSEQVASSAAVIASAVIAYPALFIYLLNPSYGLAYSVLIAAFALTGLRPAAFQNVPIIFALACGLAYLGALQLFQTGIEFRSLPQNLFFEMARPYDHQLQLFYLERIVAHLPTRFGSFDNVWYFTDRPPLETCYLLLFEPLAKFFDLYVLYQAIGTALQVTCLAAAWHLCRALRFSNKETQLSVLVLAGSGFVYYNSVYLWPKMLAASMLIAALVPLAIALMEQKRVTVPEAFVAAAGCAMALLSHGGVAYSLLALAVLGAVFASRMFTLKSALAGVAVAIALYAPWQAYSTFVDPNSGKLLKMHLTGGDPDSPEPFPTMLAKSYRSISWSHWIQNRTANVSILGGAPYVDPIIAQLKNGIIDAKKRPALSVWPESC
jgi:hypothetical protein